MGSSRRFGRFIITGRGWKLYTVGVAVSIAILIGTFTVLIQAPVPCACINTPRLSGELVRHPEGYALTIHNVDVRPHGNFAHLPWHSSFRWELRDDSGQLLQAGDLVGEASGGAEGEAGQPPQGGWSYQPWQGTGDNQSQFPDTLLELGSRLVWRAEDSDFDRQVATLTLRSTITSNAALNLSTDKVLYDAEPLPPPQL